MESRLTPIFVVCRMFVSIIIIVVRMPYFESYSIWLSRSYEPASRWFRMVDYAQWIRFCRPKFKVKVKGKVQGSQGQRQCAKYM